MDNNINIGTYDLCEFSEANRNVLIKEFSDKQYINVSKIPDFFNYTTDTRYDIIIMKPPHNITQTRFGRNYRKIDLDFVLRAYQFLEPTGNLVTLVYGPHVVSSNDHSDLLKELGASVKLFTHDWQSTQSEGKKKINIQKLELGIVILNGNKDIDYTPIAPLDIETPKKETLLEKVQTRDEDVIDDLRLIPRKKLKNTLLY